MYDHIPFGIEEIEARSLYCGRLGRDSNRSTQRLVRPPVKAILGKLKSDETISEARVETSLFGGQTGKP